MQTLNKNFLEACKTDFGGITSAQIRVLGDAFKLKKDFNKTAGWLKKIMDKELSDSQARAFFDARLIVAKSTAKDRNQKQSGLNIAQHHAHHVFCPTCGRKN